MYLVWFEEPKQPLWQIQNIFVFEHLLYHQRFSALLSENHRLELHVDLGQHGLNTLPLQKHNPTLKINFKSNIMNIKYLIISSDIKQTKIALQKTIYVTYLEAPVDLVW